MRSLKVKCRLDPYKKMIIFQINAYSTVGSIIQTVSKLIKSDRRLTQQIETIRDEISKGQM